MDRPRRRARLIALALGAAACEDDPLVGTSTLGAQFRLVSYDGYTSEASAVLRDRFHDAITLPATDEVQVSLPGWQVELIPRTDRGPWYHTQVPSAPAGAAHNFAVLRQGRPSAAINPVILPLDPAPVVPATWSRSEPLVITWAGVDLVDPLYLEVEGPCLDAVVAEVPDASGSFTFAPGEIVGDGSCGAIVTVSRVTRGSVDDELRGGSVEAWQRRERAVETSP